MANEIMLKYGCNPNQKPSAFLDSVVFIDNL